MSQIPEPEQEQRPSLRKVAVDAAPPEAYGAHPQPEEPYGAQYGPSAPAPTGSPGSSGSSGPPASTIVLLVVSGVLLLLTFWTLVGVLWAGPAALAVVALTRASADRAGARRLTRIGWWVTAGLAVLGVLLAVAVGVAIYLLVPGPVSSGYDPSTVGLTTALQTLTGAALR